METTAPDVTDIEARLDAYQKPWYVSAESIDLRAEGPVVHVALHYHAGERLAAAPESYENFLGSAALDIQALLASQGSPVTLTTSEDLDRVHELFGEFGWNAIPAELPDGRPVLLYEDEDGDLCYSDGTDGGPAAVALLPLTVIGTKAARALRTAELN